MQNRKVKEEDKNNTGSYIEIFRIIEQVYLSQQFLGISVKIAIFIFRSSFKSLNIFGIFDLLALTSAFDSIQYILFQRKAGKQRKEAFFPQTTLFSQMQKFAPFQEKDPGSISELRYHIKLCNTNCKFKQQMNTKLVDENHNGILPQFSPSLKFQHVSVEKNKTRQKKKKFLVSDFIGQIFLPFSTPQQADMFVNTV